MNQSYKFKGSSTTVGAALTDLFSDLVGVNVNLVLGNILGGGCIVNMEVQNGGAGDFTDFAILVQDHPDGVFYNWLVAADFISTNNPDMLYCSTDLSVLAAGTKGHIVFRTRAAYAFKAQAKRTNATTGLILGNIRSGS